MKIKKNPKYNYKKRKKRIKLKKIKPKRRKATIANSFKNKFNEKINQHS